MLTAIAIFGAMAVVVGLIIIPIVIDAKNVLKIYKKVINKDTNVFKKAFHGVKHILEKSGDKK